MKKKKVAKRFAKKVAKEFSKRVLIQYSVSVEGLLDTVTHNVTVNPNQPVEIHREDMCFDLTTGKDCKYSNVDATLTAKIAGTVAEAASAIFLRQMASCHHNLGKIKQMMDDQFGVDLKNLSYEELGAVHYLDKELDRIYSYVAEKIGW